MIVVFSILLYPLFFLLIFALAEYLLPTHNSALFFSLALAMVCSGLYYLLRSRAKEKAAIKSEEKAQANVMKKRMMLLTPTQFSSFFQKDILCDNGYAPLSADRLLDYLRTHAGCRKITVAAVNGVSEEAQKLAKEMGLTLQEKPTESLLQAIPEEILPVFESVPEKPCKEKLIRILRSSAFEKSIRRYGIFFLFYGFLTPYKRYYLISGIFLLGFSFLIRYERKTQRKNPQSTKSNSRSPI